MEEEKARQDKNKAPVVPETHAEEEDDLLAQALAMSMDKKPSSTAPMETEDEEMKKAILLSLGAVRFFLNLILECNAIG